MISPRGGARNRGSLPGPGSPSPQGFSCWLREQTTELSVSCMGGRGPGQHLKRHWGDTRGKPGFPNNKDKTSWSYFGEDCRIWRAFSP